MVMEAPIFAGGSRAVVMFVLIHPLTSILADKLSSKLRFLKKDSIINKQKSSKKWFFFLNVGL